MKKTRKPVTGKPAASKPLTAMELEAELFRMTRRLDALGESLVAQVKAAAEWKRRADTALDAVADLTKRVDVMAAERDRALRDMIAGALVVLRDDDPVMLKVATAIAGASSQKLAADVLKRAEGWARNHLEEQCRRSVADTLRAKLSALDMDKFLAEHVSEITYKALEAMRAMGYPLDKKVGQRVTEALAAIPDATEPQPAPQPEVPR